MSSKSHQQGRFSYSPLDHLQFGDVLEAVREATCTVAEVEDRDRVKRLLDRLERAVDVVLIEKHG